MLVLAGRSVLAHEAGAGGEGLVGGEHRTGIAIGTEVLAWVKARGGYASERARALPVPAGAVRLSGVLHDRDGVGERVAQQIDLGGLAVEMHWQDRAGPGRHCGGRRGRVDQCGVVVAVHEHRRSTGARDGLGRGDERVCGDDALVTQSDPEGAQRHLDRVRAVADADTVRRAGESGEGGLERRHGWPADERGAGQDVSPARGDLVGDLGVLGGEIDERDGGGGCCRHDTPEVGVRCSASASASTTRC